MRSFAEAYEIVLASARAMGTEPVPLPEVGGRVLAEDVASDTDMPPFDKSAMDGYACRREDLARPLRVLETIAAGAPPSRPIGAGECSKIMTGAIVPEGADCVIMVEETEETGEGTIRFTGTATRTNICFRGEDVRQGDVVLRKGTRIAPQHVALLASVGCIRPLVACRPRLGVIATGNELVEPRQRPALSQIRNSNSFQLCAQAEAAGALPTNYGIVEDTEAAIERALRKAMDENDVVLLSGGVSMGEFDFVPAVLERCGVDIRFRKIAVKPGRPTVFGVTEKAFCFGLPGNPVSTFVLFELLVKPFVLKMMGHEHRPKTFRSPLAKAIRRKRTQRDSWMPVCLTEAGALAVSYHGSAHVAALCSADGLICVPKGVAELPEGTLVDVRPI